jgi:hypothetical protein
VKNLRRVTNSSDKHLVVMWNRELAASFSSCEQRSLNEN